MVVRKQVQYYLSDFLEIVTKALKIQNDTILIQFGKKTKGFLNFPFYSSESRHSNQTALQVSTVHFSLDLHADLLQQCLKTEYHLRDFLCLHVTAICTFLSLILGQVACGGGSISGFAQHIILLIWTFSCHTNGNQFLNWASVAVPYLVTEAFSEQSGFNVTLVVGLSVVILQLCFQGNSVTVMVKLLTAY